MLKHQGTGDITVLHRPDEFCQILCEWSRPSGYIYQEANAIGAMAHQYGRGRVYWQCAPSDPNYPDLLGLLRCGVAWAAGIPSPGGRHAGGRMESSITPQQGGTGDRTPDIIDILKGKIFGK